MKRRILSAPCKPNIPLRRIRRAVRRVKKQRRNVHRRGCGLLMGFSSDWSDSRLAQKAANERSVKIRLPATFRRVTMNDRELADKVVALGVGRFELGGYSVRPPDEDISKSHEFRTTAGFVRDWRVVGALMEKVDAHFIERLSERMWAVRSDKPYGEGKTRDWYENESLPRAIIEACVEALTAVGDRQ